MRTLKALWSIVALTTTALTGANAEIQKVTVRADGMC